MTETRPFQQEREIAEKAVRAACLLTKKVLAKVEEIEKSDHSPVTIADFASQAILISAVHHAFPNDGLMGEEDATSLRENAALTEQVWNLIASVQDDAIRNGIAVPVPSNIEDMLTAIDKGGNGEGGPTGRFWAMDPVDGTKAFLLGQQYAVSLALIEDGKEVVGILGCPNVKLNNGKIEEETTDKDGLGVLLSAVRGQGSTVRNMNADGSLDEARQLERLAAPADLKDLHVVDCWLSKAYDHDIVRQLAEASGAQYPGTEVYSSLVRYAALIIGGGDFQLRVPNSDKTTMHVWDHAGAQLMFTEIGGKVTDLDGKPIDFGAGRSLANNRGMLAAKEDIHSEVLALLAELLAKKSAA